MKFGPTGSAAMRYLVAVGVAFAAFLAADSRSSSALVARPEPSSSPPTRVLVLPLRPAPPKADLQAVADALRTFYGFEVVIAKATPMPKSAWTAPRRRWRADKLLDWLEPQTVALDDGLGRKHEGPERLALREDKRQHGEAGEAAEQAEDDAAPQSSGCGSRKKSGISSLPGTLA